MAAKPRYEPGDELPPGADLREIFGAPPSEPRTRSLPIRTLLSGSSSPYTWTEVEGPRSGVKTYELNGGAALGGKIVHSYPTGFGGELYFQLNQGGSPTYKYHLFFMTQPIYGNNQLGTGQPFDGLGDTALMGYDVYDGSTYVTALTNAGPTGDFDTWLYDGPAITDARVRVTGPWASRFQEASIGALPAHGSAAPVGKGTVRLLPSDDYWVLGRVHIPVAKHGMRISNYLGDNPGATSGFDLVWTDSFPGTVQTGGWKSVDNKVNYYEDGEEFAWGQDVILYNSTGPGTGMNANTVLLNVQNWLFVSGLELNQGYGGTDAYHGSRDIVPATHPGLWNFSGPYSNDLGTARGVLGEG